MGTPEWRSGNGILRRNRKNLKIGMRPVLSVQMYEFNPKNEEWEKDSVCDAYSHIYDDFRDTMHVVKADGQVILIELHRDFDPDASEMKRRFIPKWLKRKMQYCRNRFVTEWQRQVYVF